MIISKDLFIFGEQLFATIIPEGSSSQTAQQQQQQQLRQQNQSAIQQQQLLAQEQPHQLAIINTTTFTTDVETTTQIVSAVNAVGAPTITTTTTPLAKATIGPKANGIGGTVVATAPATATAIEAAEPIVLVDGKTTKNTNTKLQKVPKEVELKCTQYYHKQQQLQQLQPTRTRKRESQQKGPSGVENDCMANKINANNTGKQQPQQKQQQQQPKHEALVSHLSAATVATTPPTENIAASARIAPVLSTSVIVQVEEEANSEKEPLVRRNFAKIIATPATRTFIAAPVAGEAGTVTGAVTAIAAIEETNQINDFATHLHEVTPLLPADCGALQIQQQQQQQQQHTTTDHHRQFQLQLQLPLPLSLLSEEGLSNDELPSASTTTTIAATSDRSSYDTTAVVEPPFAGHSSSLNSDEDLPSLTTTTTTTATMSKVILDNNTSDPAMSAFPFISDTEPHLRTLQLSFQNLNVLHNERQILSDVSGLVSPGEVLAVMGPSGSGKTTLLDCLSGQRRFDSGGVYLNREPLSKKWRRKICYVLQEEIFFSGLTLRETVMYTALLRLPEKMSKTEKIKLVDRILEALELTFCQHTKFGDYLNRGLSGGEKKRANIACELLTNPLLMLLDEPTSGLDSHSAISLMKFLKRYAVQEQKTVVITVHQPSSQMFHMFDKLLLLYNGRTAYFGEVNNIYTYFESIGVAIKPHYNPADFVLEQLKSYPKIREQLFIAAKESHGNYLNRNCITVNTNNQHNQQHHSNNHQLHLRHNGDAANTITHIAANNSTPATTTSEIINEKSHKHDALINDIINNYYKDIHNNHKNHINHDAMLIISDHQHSNEEASQQLWYGHDSQSNSSATSSDCHRYESCGDSDWLDYPTSFHTQFCVLSSRNFKEARPRMLSKLNWFQTIGLALMAGSIWFQIPRTEEFLHDLQGWMFFSQTYWMLFALFGALNSFPAEREVISKERRSGAYRLSAYYLAKMFGELPLVVTLPTVYLMISYPMLGCTSFKLFFLMLVFLLLNTIVAQSVGFFIGACCMDMNVSITLSALYTLATQLFGGYLSTRIPDGLSWIRYTSMIHYAYQNMQILEFREGPAIRCGNPSSFEICKTNDTTSMFIPYEEILKAQNSTAPLWLNTLVLMMFFMVFRGLGYAVLRYVRCPKA
ncbi:ABC transporter G family member 1 isoform X2 [Anastrepha ludens]|uniref:ABC transporter G family member 1 isoform X2 n=1 Tax=Anastrepha ludens TaxID=28586 RepID=UPI0023B1CB68|nr:ABC transporter G family member 1 isoform X2 [Anastrepha ludens]